jgi:exodeoxyribonuclease VII small subunit
MSENTKSFDDAIQRLEEIAIIVQDKELDLDKSLDFLEEGIKLANFCTEKINQTSLQN